MFLWELYAIQITEVLQIQAWNSALKYTDIYIWGKFSELMNQEKVKKHTARASSVVQYLWFYNKLF